MPEISWFERLVIRAVAFLLMFIVAIATAWLVFHVLVEVWSVIAELETSIDLQNEVQGGMAGVFVILLGLELLETLKTYATHRRFRLEVVLVVGAIAVARHLIQIDFHHADGLYLAGFGVLIASLVAGYFLLQRLPAKDTTLGKQ